jgi:hypothetical protein
MRIKQGTDGLGTGRQKCRNEDCTFLEAQYVDINLFEMLIGL